MTCALVACGVAAVATVLCGCAGSSAVSSAVDPVAQAAEVSELAPGFKASFEEQIRLPGSPVASASGTADFERNGQRAIVVVQAHADGKSYTTTAQYAGGELYMNVPGAHSSSVAHGKKWIEYDVDDVEAALGVKLSSLSTPGTSSSAPSQQLAYLRAVGGAVTRLGAQQVQGIPTTHYRATIDWERYPERVPASQRAAARASVAVLERLTGSSEQTVDVWIDAEHRVRREELVEQECVPGAPGKSETRFRYEYFDFGPQAIPKPPASREVANVTRLIERELSHVTLGCS